MTRDFTSVAGAVLRRNLIHAFTNPALLIPSAVFPLLFFVAFAGGLSNVGNVPGFDFPSGYTAFPFVFVFLQSAAFGGVFTGFGIAGDFESGFARRLLLTTENRLSILLGYAIAAVMRMLITVTVLTVVALAVGMQIDGQGTDLFAMLLLAVLVNATATMWAAGVAFRIRTIQAMPLIQLPVFLILFMAPVYVPLSLLEGWVSAVAPLNPFTLLIDTVRSLISGQPDLVLAAFATAFGLLALFGTWAIRGMRVAERAG
jgi:ABC-2 type transport system permease protein